MRKSIKALTAVALCGVVLSGVPTAQAAVPVTQEAVSALHAAIPAVRAAAPAGRGGPAANPAVSLNGSGGVTLEWPGWKGDKARFVVHVNGVPGSAHGTFHVTHWRAGGKVFADFDGTMDCVVVGGGVAVATGVIRHVAVQPQGLTITVGRRVGFTVLAQGRHDMLGWSWAVDGFDKDVLPCTGTAPLVNVDNGGYTVRG